MTALETLARHASDDAPLSRFRFARVWYRVYSMGIVGRFAIDHELARLQAEMRLATYLENVAWLAVAEA
jgi:hypothetical protein